MHETQGHKPRNEHDLLKLENTKDELSLRASRRNQPTDMRTLAPIRFILDF